MQLSGNSTATASAARAQVRAGSLTKLAELRDGETAIIDNINLPAEMACRLMELGFLPGSPVQAARSAPGGDPRVFRVDGSEIALRRETADHVVVRR